MGIINLTPDSFYDGGKIKSDKDLLNKVEKFISQGADFIDIGGYSSRPGVHKLVLSTPRVDRTIEWVDK